MTFVINQFFSPGKAGAHPSKEMGVLCRSVLLPSWEPRVTPTGRKMILQSGEGPRNTFWKR